MTKDEFLELLGKGQPDADEKLIAAVEKVLKDGVLDESAEHSDITDALADAYDEIEHLTKDEFLELLGKGQPDANEKLIAAVEKVLKDGIPDKLAEHSDIIDVLADAYDEIEHYGVDGMKWGVQNGPPYPLSRSKRAKLRKQDKARILLDNVDDLSIEQIKDLVTRIELEEKIEKMTREDKEKGKSYVGRILAKSGDALIDKVVPAATEFAFKQIIQNVAGEDVVKEMFPKKK